MEVQVRRAEGGSGKVRRLATRTLVVAAVTAGVVVAAVTAGVVVGGLAAVPAAAGAGTAPPLVVNQSTHLPVGMTPLATPPRHTAAHPARGVRKLVYCGGPVLASIRSVEARCPGADRCAPVAASARRNTRDYSDPTDAPGGACQGRKEQP